MSAWLLGVILVVIYVLCLTICRTHMMWRIKWHVKDGEESREKSIYFGRLVASIIFIIVIVQLFSLLSRYNPQWQQQVIAAIIPSGTSLSSILEKLPRYFQSQPVTTLCAIIFVPTVTGIVLSLVLLYIITQWGFAGLLWKIIHWGIIIWLVVMTGLWSRVLVPALRFAGLPL